MPRHSLLATKPRLTALVASILLLGAATAFGVASTSLTSPVRDVSIELQAPDLGPQLLQLEQDSADYTHEERIHRGDTVGSLLNRLQVSDPEAERFIRTDRDAGAIVQLKPGRLIQAITDGNGTLRQLRYFYSNGDSQSTQTGGRELLIERTASGFQASEPTSPMERRVELRSAEITSSLFGATDAAGIPDRIASQIPEIFSGDVDFYRDLHRGDRLRVIYERFYQRGEPARVGRILAIEFYTAGKNHQAVWFQPQGQAGGYYGPDGQSLRRAFLRAPLQFTRISSGFGGRLHPILNTWKQHTGVDYAAPIGTPVRSTADGLVTFVGQQTGYGNAIAIQHQGVYSTLYGHLSRFAAGLRRGQRIAQGDLIGYVGMTGWATGPHLHYEFRIAGVAHDPLKTVMPNTLPIERGQLAAFKGGTADFARDIALLRSVDAARPATLMVSRRSPG